MKAAGAGEERRAAGRHRRRRPQPPGRTPGGPVRRHAGRRAPGRVPVRGQRRASRADGWKADYKLVDTPEALKDFLKQLKKQKRFAFDLETTGLDPLRSEIVGYAFSWKDGEGYYLAGPRAGRATRSSTRTRCSRP